MAQHTAVYYPHTTLRSPDLLRTALLLWDHVDCIVPWPNFEITQDLPPELAAGAELVLRPRYPTPAEKAKVHEEVIGAFSNGVPRWVTTALKDGYQHPKYHPSRYDDDYLIYPPKFLEETWDELSRLDVARWLDHAGDYAVPPALGLTMMASLAAACAGTQQHRITDRVHAYSALVGMTSASLGGELLENVTASSITKDIDRLVTVPMRILDGSAVPMKRLIELRKREAKDSSKDLRRMRHKYLDTLSAPLKDLSVVTSANDARELDHQFREKMEADLSDLKKELKMARNDFLLSKEVGLLIVAAAGLFTVPLAFAPIAAAANSVGVGALLHTGMKYKRARAKALLEHPASWLYLA
jgi:hypothetical protein